MISVFKPKINFFDILSVLKSLMSNNISGTSPVINEFEEKLARKFQRKYCVAVSNGSVAIDLSLQALDLEEGDEVIIPSFTIVSVLSAVMRTTSEAHWSKLTWTSPKADVAGKYSSLRLGLSLAIDQ